MANLPWLDRVRDGLDRQALPSSYIERFIEELSDHIEDLKVENMETDASSRLGKPEQVAEAAIKAYRRRSFIGRHSTAAFLVFGISPVIAHYVMLLILVFVLATFTGNYQYNNLEIGLSLTIMACSIFVGALYCEFAVWLGIGKKWMLTSCAVLGVIAMLGATSQNNGIGLLTVMLLVQFAAPFGVGLWFTKQKRNRGYPATTLFISVISPVILLMFLWVTVALAVNQLLLLSCTFVTVHIGPIATWTLCYASIILTNVFPPVAASFIYCKFARRTSIGWKWILVSCTALAMLATMQSFRLAIILSENNNGLPLGLIACIILLQFTAPLAIGFWFLRRKHEPCRVLLTS